MYWRPSPTQRPIFQSARYPRYISIQEAREVYEVCKTIRKIDDRMATYEMFGMDGKHVEQYLNVVENLNDMLRRTEEFERFRKAKHIQIGPFHIFIHFDWWS